MMDDVIQYGRAFREGDVVLLRPRRPVSQAQAAQLGDQLRAVQRETGVTLLLLPFDVDVIERADCDGPRPPGL